MEQEKKDVPQPAGLSAFALKVIALASMTVDHIGAILVLPVRGFWAALPYRYIGRLAFPIYCFLLTEGFFHTGSRRRYLARLLLFGIATEPIYDRVLYGGWINWNNQNILFTLALGLLAMAALERAARWVLGGPGRPVRAALGAVFCAGLAVLFCLLAEGFHVSYGWQGMLTILAYYFLRRWRWAAALGGAAVQFAENNFIQYGAAAAAVPIALYNGKKGKAMNKWLFYGYYPVHLAVLGLVFALSGSV